MKDWTGNVKSTWTTVGASNHSDTERASNDFYATNPLALEELLKLEKFNKHVWECACGQGHLSKVLIRHGYNVLNTDLYDRGYGQAGVDFLKCNKIWEGDILTNPPYKYAQEFVEKALELVKEGNRVIMFLRLLFLEGQKRRKLFKTNPPKVIYVSSSRITCYLNGVETDASSAIAYSWFIWEKGYKGDTIIKWFN